MISKHVMFRDSMTIRFTRSNFYLPTCKYICGIIVLFLIGCSLPPRPFNPDAKGNNDYQSAIQYSQNYLQRFIKKTGSVGFAVAVIDSDRVVYSEGFGYADKEAEKKVTDSTTFMIGSVTKLFTATAIMQLVEQGKIVLDSPITTYIPEFVIKTRFTDARPIIVRDLLIHESGLPNIVNGEEIGHLPCAGSDTMYRTVPALLAKEYVANPPRTHLSYCNIAFSLCGIIIERTSGQTYSQYIRDSIFTKLGMDNSSLDFNDIRVKHLFSKGYDNKREELPYYLRDVPTGMIVTNTIDLSKFMKMLLANGTLNGKHILNASTLHQMWEPQNTGIPLDFDTFGLTYWLTNPTRIPLKIVHHGGFIPPYSTFFAAFPDSKLGVIVLCNSLPSPVIEATTMLLETFYEAKTECKLPEPSKSKKLPVVKLTAKKLNELAGFYQFFGEGTAKVKVKGSDLVFSGLGTTGTLIPHSDSTFSPQNKLLGFIPLNNKELRNVTVEFKSITGRKIAVLRTKDFFFTLIGEKFEPETPPKEWLARVGKYEPANEHKFVFANKEIEKEYKSDPLVLSYDSTDKILSLHGYPIKPISPSEAVTIGIGRDAGETFRAYNENGEEYLWVSGYSLRKIIEVKK